MKPAWLARMLVWAGALLFLYWGALKNYDDGAAFSVGLMLGAGSLVYNGKPRPVFLTLAVTLIVGGFLLLAPAMLKNPGGSPAVFFFGYLMGLLGPLLAWRFSRNEAQR